MKLRIQRTIVGAALLSTVAGAQSMTNQHVSSTGVQANFYAAGDRPSVSDDNRYVAFASQANNLAPGDAGIGRDIFVHDNVSGATVLISHNAAGFATAGGEARPWLSSTGRFVVFQSDATDLVAGVAGGQIYRYDRDTDADGIFDEAGATVTILVSAGPGGVAGNAASTCYTNSVSDDGDVVAFNSDATNLVAGDTNGVSDCFVRLISAGTTTRVSVSSAGVQGMQESEHAAISGDGTIVAFNSYAPNLVGAFDTNGRPDVFRHVRATATTTLVSVSSAGVLGNGYSIWPAISDDGDRIVYESTASNLVAGDTNSATDVFVRTVSAATTARVTVATGGAQGFFGGQDAHISGDGRMVSFTSGSPNLVPGDSNWQDDVFVHVIDSVLTVRANRAAFDGTPSNDSSTLGSVSDDGTFVAFLSFATNLVAGDTNGFDDIFLRGQPLLGPELPPIVSFCPGIDCPCADGLGGAGCANSANPGGAVLAGAGVASISADSLALTASSMTGAVAVFFQGATQTPPTMIDDGLGCVGGPVVRLGTKVSVGGTAMFPDIADPLVSVRGAIPAIGGLYSYQCLYRNAVTAFCPTATSNRTNAVQINWAP